MSSNQDIMEKRHAFTDCDEKYICKVRRNDHNYRQVYEYDKKLKREIANSNERRRMQSINMGFETLKQLLPMTIEGEKLSKASILQFTAKYIQSLIARLTTLEKEVASYKKSILQNNKDKVFLSKSTPSVIQEQNRKRRLNSCTVECEIAQTEPQDPIQDVSATSTYTTLKQEDSSMNCHASEKTPGSLEHLVAAIEQVEGEKFYVSPTNNELKTHIMIEEINSDSSSIIESNNDSFEVTEPNPRSISHVKLELNNPENENSSTSSIITNNNDSTVMKPTISPYTEKIILAVSQNPHMFENRASNYSFNNASQPSYQLLSNEHLFVPSGFHRNYLGSPRVSTIPHKHVHQPDGELEKNHTL